MHNIICVRLGLLIIVLANTNTNLDLADLAVKGKKSLFFTQLASLLTFD
ncbi:MAG: hypothetical protein CLLPBCKN_003131 [Chroococcidiopsis cubana SAG 39.79]|jgi:hypothetical protein|nr:hypothetical protein [Chroococcidiopsis cubana SAG 39.79]